MEKIKKIVLIILLSTFILIFSSMLLIFIYNKLMLKSEEKLLENAPGEIYQINNHKMHIYTEGDGEKALIFMAAFGETSPTYSYKELYSKLSDKYKIVVIEKAGYGYSDKTDVSRDINTLVYEDRKLLELANIKKPYILIPYSLSGLEALYWLQEYPEEIDGIISLEMAIPGIYDNTSNYSLIEDIGVKVGFTRFPILYNMLYDESYTEHEWDLVKVLWFKNAYNKTVQNEANLIYKNSQQIDLNLLDYSKFFVSFMNQSTIENNNNWYTLQNILCKNFKYNNFYILNTTHTRIIRDESEFISNKIKETLNIIYNND